MTLVPLGPAERLAALVRGHGDELPLDEAVALFAAAEDPSVHADDVLASIDQLARGLYLPPDEPMHLKVARLVRHLFDEHGFEGDSADYDDPENSLIHKVIERRRGLPILLSVLTCEVARRADFEVVGVGFPNHFLVMPVGAEPAFYLDPFHGGRVVTLPTLQHKLLQMGVPTSMHPRFLGALSPRLILVRMCLNLRGSYLRRGMRKEASRVEARLAVLQEGM
jgi:regulator of sirC expression with transglutaminase-like and TPR domain